MLAAMTFCSCLTMQQGQMMMTTGMGYEFTEYMGLAMVFHGQGGNLTGGELSITELSEFEAWFGQAFLYITSIL